MATFYRKSEIPEHIQRFFCPAEIGLEASLSEYIATMVDVFREVRRVLRDDGTLWLNIGDSYAGSGKGPEGNLNAGESFRHLDGTTKPYRSGTCKPKDLVGIPWLLAFALRADGWWLRQDIIWSKPNPMPESVRDRCTKAHEMIFLLSKSARYFFDADAIREGVSETGVIERTDCYDESLVLLQNLRAQMASTDHALGAPLVSRGNRGGIFERGVRHATAILQRAQRQDNLSLPTFDAEVGQKRGDRGAGLSVVHVPVIRRAATEAARFADGDISAKEFLEEVDRLCVALPDGDDFKEAWCADFSSPAFIHTNGDRPVAIHDASKVGQIEFVHNQQSTIARASSYSGRNKRSVWHIATAPFPEAHFATFPPALVEPCILAGSREGDVVLDPFIGSGTTAMVARQLGRRAIGIDLNSEYLAMARRRVGEQLALLDGAR